MCHHNAWRVLINVHFVDTDSTVKDRDRKAPVVASTRAVRDEAQSWWVFCNQEWEESWCITKLAFYMFTYHPNISLLTQSMSFKLILFNLVQMQNWPWQRWGRVWSRRENGWWPRWKSRRSQRSSRRWMRPKRSNGAPTAGKRPSSTAAGIQVTVITPASKPTGQNTWSPAHSQVIIKLTLKC